MFGASAVAEAAKSRAAPGGVPGAFRAQGTEAYDARRYEGCQWCQTDVKLTNNDAENLLKNQRRVRYECYECYERCDKMMKFIKASATSPSKESPKRSKMKSSGTRSKTLQTLGFVRCPWKNTAVLERLYRIFNKPKKPHVWDRIKSLENDILRLA